MAILMDSSNNVRYNPNSSNSQAYRGISFWFKVPNAISAFNRTLLNINNGGSVGIRINIPSNSTSVVYTFDGAGGAVISVTSQSGSVIDNTWTHVFGLVIPSTGVSIYINGVGQTTIGSPGNGRQAANMYFCSDFNASDSVEFAEFATWITTSTFNPPIDVISGLSKGFIPSRYYTNILECYIPFLTNLNDAFIDNSLSRTVVGSPTKTNHPLMLI